MGLMRNIVVVEYDPRWPAKFEAEAQLLNDALSPTLEVVHHIGSTSVPGLAAKPIIDILAVVHCLEKLDTCDSAMKNLGYVVKGEFGIPGRRYYSKGRDAHRTHHVHAFELRHPAIDAHLAFRDYLRAHEEQTDAYAKLKVRLAEQHRNDIEAYMEGKESFIKEVLSKALQ